MEVVNYHMDFACIYNNLRILEKKITSHTLLNHIAHDAVHNFMNSKTVFIICRLDDLDEKKKQAPTFN